MFRELTVIMASSDWLEVQKLAAEFQRAQLSSALQKYGNASIYINIILLLHGCSSPHLKR